MSEPVYKRCKACEVPKELWEFNIREKKHLGSKNPSHYRTDCSACRGKNQYVRIMDRKIQAYPNLYLECDDCDIPFPKSKVRCPRCFPSPKSFMVKKEKETPVAEYKWKFYPTLINPWTKEETPSDQLIASLEGVDSFNEVMGYNEIKRDVQFVFFNELFNR